MEGQNTSVGRSIIVIVFRCLWWRFVYFIIQNEWVKRIYIFNFCKTNSRNYLRLFGVSVFVESKTILLPSSTVRWPMSFSENLYQAPRRIVIGARRDMNGTDIIRLIRQSPFFIYYYHHHRVFYTTIIVVPYNRFAPEGNPYNNV